MRDECYVVIKLKVREKFGGMYQCYCGTITAIRCVLIFCFVCSLDRVITRLQNCRREKTVYSKKSFVQFSLIDVY